MCRWCLAAEPSRQQSAPWFWKRRASSWMTWNVCRSISLTQLRLVEKNLLKLGAFSWQKFPKGSLYCTALKIPILCSCHFFVYWHRHTHIFGCMLASKQISSRSLLELQPYLLPFFVGAVLTKARKIMESVPLYVLQSRWPVRVHPVQFMALLDQKSWAIATMRRFFKLSSELWEHFQQERKNDFCRGGKGVVWQISWAKVNFHTCNFPARFFPHVHLFRHSRDLHAFLVQIETHASNPGYAGPRFDGRFWSFFPWTRFWNWLRQIQMKLMRILWWRRSRRKVSAVRARMMVPSLHFRNFESFKSTSATKMSSAIGIGPGLMWWPFSRNGRWRIWTSSTGMIRFRVWNAWVHLLSLSESWKFFSSWVTRAHCGDLPRSEKWNGCSVSRSVKTVGSKIALTGRKWYHFIPAPSKRCQINRIGMVNWHPLKPFGTLWKVQVGKVPLGSKWWIKFQLDSAFGKHHRCFQK